MKHKHVIAIKVILLIKILKVFPPEIESNLEAKNHEAYLFLYSNHNCITRIKVKIVRINGVFNFYVIAIALHQARYKIPQKDDMYTIASH